MKQSIFCGGALCGSMARTLVTLLGAMAAVSAAEVLAGAEEAIPDADAHLTLSELRWCTFEPLRIDGGKTETNRSMRWEIEEFNARVRAFNDRCSKKTYKVTDKATIEAELTVAKRQALRQDGIVRVRHARFEREKRRIFVKDGVATVHASPGHAGEELGRVKRWGELIKTGRVHGPWYEVEWRTPRIETALKFGWVLGGLVESGSGEKARFDYCEMHKEGRAKHNEIVRGSVEPGRAASITVDNQTGKDAYVKLVGTNSEVALAFLARAGRIATVNGIPLGSYKIAFGTGRKFSRGCDSFSIRGTAKQFRQRIDYKVGTAGWKLSLHTVSDGNAPVNSIGYDDFDRL